ncbi:MAG: type IX secretion system outer membrane channel protein PorV [Bacteroidota bacterium]|nr:type IX secretion system outer membrane channel protein PorV [Bacteroidota bacterium]
MKKIALITLCLLSFKSVFAQSYNRAITTAVPFLMITADARSAGMGDVGVASSADGFSQQHNPAKYAFAQDKHGVSVSYTPYLTEIVNDINLGQLNYYNRLDQRSALSGSLRYFGLGEIILTQGPYDPGRRISPSELALDLAYSLKLSDRFAMAVAGRYIRSGLKIPDATVDASAANGFAVDVAGYYQSERKAYGEFDGRWRAGFNIQNIGPKISYNNDDFNGNFLPTNLRLGGGFDFIMDEYSTIGITLETTKLLVPTPQIEEGMTREELDAAIGQYNNTSWASGIFSSFGDAPGGFSEELKEFTLGGGAEYTYKDSFALRLGYFSEHQTKGARQYFTLGAGFKFSSVSLNVSYLLSTSKVQNPLENTLRFSLTFNFGDKYEEI